MDCDIYMEQPEGFAKGNPKEWVYMLVKVLHGTKQGGSCGNRKMCSVLKSPEFKQSYSDAALYVMSKGDVCIILPVMVSKHKASLCVVERKNKLELTVMGVTFWDDLWVDILEHITMSPMGWQDVQAAWQSIKLSDGWYFYSVVKELIFLYCKAPLLLDDFLA